MAFGQPDPESQDNYFGPGDGYSPGQASGSAGGNSAGGYSADGYFGPTGGYRPNDIDKPKTYLVWAILSTLLCCMPLGVASIVYAAKVDSTWANGNEAAAAEFSNKAKKFAIWAAVIGAVFWILYVISAIFLILFGIADYTDPAMYDPA